MKTLRHQPLREQVAVIAGGGGLVGVDNIREGQAPRAGAIHVRNLARTLIYTLGLDRDVIIEDINLYAR